MSFMLSMVNFLQAWLSYLVIGRLVGLLNQDDAITCSQQVWVLHLVGDLSDR